MHRKRRLYRDLEGSGFLESIFAIMVISCSLTFFLASLQATTPSANRTEDLEREAEDWSIKILSLTTDDGSTIRRSSLGRAQSISSGQMACSGVRCEIQTLGQEITIIPIISIGEVPALIETCYVLTIPVNYIGEGQDVMAALLRVVVW
jgi:hypothetical protein